MKELNQTGRSDSLCMLKKNMIDSVATSTQAITLLNRCYHCEFYCGKPTYAKCSKCLIQHDMKRVYLKMQDQMQMRENLFENIKIQSNARS